MELEVDAALVAAVGAKTTGAIRTGCFREWFGWVPQVA
jgi:hypothetical protein